MTTAKPSVGRTTGFISLTLLQCCLVAAVQAKLKDTPPKSVSLDGQWQLDAEHSDDPADVIAAAREEAHQSGRHHGGGMHGGMRGGGGFPGGGMGGGMGGGGMGGYGRNQQGAASENAEPSASSSSRTARQQLMNDLMTNPSALTVLAHDHALKISTDNSNSDCEARGKFSVSDGNGDGERQCGWDGRAWTIETAYSHSFTRTDRYELSGDARQVTYVTTISGDRVPKIKLKRIYLLAATSAAAAKQ